MVTTIVVRTVMVYGIISGTSGSMTEERRLSLRIQCRSEYCNRHNQQERRPGQHRMSFLSVWTAEKLPLFGASLEIMGKQLPKKMSPGVPARAKTIFPVIDRSRDSTRGTIGSLHHFCGHRTIRPAAPSRSLASGGSRCRLSRRGSLRGGRSLVMFVMLMVRGSGFCWAGGRSRVSGEDAGLSKKAEDRS